MPYSFDPSKLSPFKLLPDEMLVHILQFLDCGSLKCAVQLDKRFLGVVTQSSKIMKKMPLSVLPYDEAKNREIEKLNRRYQEVKFYDIPHDRWFNYMLDSLTTVGRSVETVNFNDCLFSNGITDVLSCFPNVKKLNLISTGVNDINSGPITSLMFPKLEAVCIECYSSVSLFLLSPFFIEYYSFD